MADIDVVPKHRSNVWLWVVLAIVVIVCLIWAFAGASHRTSQREPLPQGVLSHLTAGAETMSLV